jgi:choice-of-anchor B domain-containing protein
MSKNVLACLLLMPLFSFAQNGNLQLLGHLAYDSVTLAGCGHYAGADGKEYALVGHSKGMNIVDVTDPAHPFQRFNIPGPGSLWREVKTWNGYAYVGSEAGHSGISIVDLHFLPDSIRWKVWYGDGIYENQVDHSHTVQAQDGYLYIFGGGNVTNGATIADISDPWNPHIVGLYTANYVHDGFIRGNILWTSEIFKGQFGVVDISDKTHPNLLITHPTPGAFNHNAWLSDDNQTLFTTDEQSGAPLGAFDVTDLSNIKLLSKYYPSAFPAAEVHNVRVLNDFLINPSYGGQLTLVDAARPANLIETGIVSLGSSLVWDADPFLPSGIILATGEKEGLYIYKPTYQRAAYLEGQVVSSATGFPLNAAQVVITGGQKQDSSNAQGLYKTGTILPGTYTVTFSKPGYHTKAFPNITMETGVLTTLNVALDPNITGASEAGQAPGVTVFPKLFQDKIHVEFAAGSFPAGQAGVVELMNSTGQSVFSAALTGESTDLRVPSRLSTGVYFLRIFLAGRPIGVVRLEKGE